MCPEVSVTVASAERSEVSVSGTGTGGGGGGLASALGGLGLGRPSTSSISMPGVSVVGGSSLAAAAGSAVVSALPATQASGRRDNGASPGGGAGIGGHAPRRPDEDVELPLIKVVVLGAAGVGKTALVKRFVSNEFPREHRATTSKSEFFPSLVLNEALFELKLIDLPPIPYFPPDTDAEWRDFRFFGLRSASAYLLVYDASSPSTFQHVKLLRDQMYQTRDMTNVPVIVAANKSDRAAAAAAAAASSSSSSQQHQHHNQHQQHKGLPPSSSSMSSADRAARDRKDAAHLVRKSWRSAHVDCSAKYNWNVVSVFRELAVMLDMIANGQVIGAPQPQPKRKRCFVF